MLLRAPGLAAALLLCSTVAPAVWAADPPPAEQEIIYMGEATGILGRQVIGPNGEQVGRIADVLVDEDGLPRAALIDFGGFMGIGERRIAVAWRALHFVTSGPSPHILIDLTVDQIKSTPEWKPTASSHNDIGTMAAPPAKPATVK